MNNIHPNMFGIIWVIENILSHKGGLSKVDIPNRQTPPLSFVKGYGI